ncbi:HAMP domain-containing histidine kinase [Clostridium sp. NSJ-6]|uniref:histidine kinase n=1 Tax=Clostridium hominis TaxID=2763036 RepID=A0ABR7D7S7_9CLOT|nr:HAMP domain-containing sensor histidine kinase [Clostridium hominis]MBC5627420.1 HAMP domain-containing histidine kinase [Clostridium hominis]
MSKSISKKLFTITFSLILSVFVINMIVQLLFFEDFYLDRKVKDLKNEVNTFRTMYSYQLVNKNTLYNALSSYEESNNSKMAIFSLDGKLKYLTNYEGGVDDSTTLTAFCADLLSNNELIDRVLTHDTVEWTIFIDKSSDSKKIGVVSPMSLQNFNDSIIISVSSIQPIQEAASVIKSFYFYLLICILFVAIILSNIYAKLISKPLIKINKVAEKMSNLDFNAKCDITSQDEIGSLANTLNFLSSNLENALDDLKDKNLKLENEIERERNLENMRKDFVTSVSHDLKTPIGIIGGYAEALKDDIVTGEDRKIYLETIIDEANKMNSLLNSMLDLSRLETDKATLELEDFNIVRLLQGMIKKFSLELTNKNIAANFIALPPYAYVNGDILKIEQVIQNILTNGIKYSPEGSNINISVVDQNDNFVISIENTGVNIPEKELENIFAKFYRLDKSGDRTKKSYGLGLSIVKRILDLHNSVYSINNTSDGVLFKFTLSKSIDIEE